MRGMSSRERAFRRIYETHGPAVQASLSRRVAAEHVDDLTSETFMVAWRKLPRDVRDPLPWLYAVARREVLAHRRRQAGGQRLVERLMALTPRPAGAGLAPGEARVPAPLAPAF